MSYNYSKAMEGRTWSHYMLSGNYILVLYQCRYLALQLSGNIWPAELVGHLTHPVLLARHPFYFGDYFDSYPSSET